MLSARPGDEESLLRLGTELLEQERFADALEQFQEAGRTNPPTALTALGSAFAGAALMKLGRTGEARAALEQARALQATLFEERPEFAQLCVELGGD